VTRPIVVIETPYNAADEAGVRRNIRFARACVRDSLMRGEAPFASHLLYTQPGILNDRVPEERAHGIEAGFDVGAAASLTALYMNLGMSRGMALGAEAANRCNRVVESRRLPDDWDSDDEPTREGW
jgi:hypothetical protein